MHEWFAQASILVEMKNLTYSWEDVAILRTLFAFSFQFPSNVINKTNFAFIRETRFQLPVRLYLWVMVKSTRPFSALLQVIHGYPIFTVQESFCQTSDITGLFSRLMLGLPKNGSSRPYRSNHSENSFINWLKTSSRSVYFIIVSFIPMVFRKLRKVKRKVSKAFPYFQVSGMVD